MALMVYVVPFFVTVLTIIVLRQCAPAWGLSAAPGQHRVHAGAPPLVGGIAMFLGWSCGWVLIAGSWPLWLCALVVVVAGAWDDIHEISTGARFLAQILAAIIMIYWGEVVLHDLGYLVSDDSRFYLGRWAVALTIFGAVGVMNSINMSDGMDGLAGSMTFISAAAILVAAWYGDLMQSVVEIGIFLTIIAAFLLFNIRFFNDKPARVFMGDAGSTLLGLLLAWYLVKHTQEPYKLFSPVTALWIIALPLFDAVGVLAWRVLKGTSPFNADRGHYHHYLVDMGLTVNQALLASLACALLFIVVGLSGYVSGVPDHLMFYLFLLLFFCYLVFRGIMDRKIKT